MIKRVELSEDAKKLLDEFYEILNDAYKKYLEFHDARCKSCGDNCHETKRILESHIKFVIDTFTFAVEKLCKEKPELTGAAVSILQDHLNKWIISNFISAIVLGLGKSSETNYIR